MNCPKCGHDIKEHWEAGCICSCELTEAQALLAAQRRAAAELFKEIWMENKPPEVTAILVSFVERVLRKCKVLEENERYEMLLPLIMNKNSEGEQ